MLVGLMCWFAAKVTRSPCLARFAASAIAPRPMTSAVVNRVAPSAGESRSPCSILSASGTSAASLISRRSICATTGTVLRLEPLDGERHVVAAEAEAIAQRGRDGPFYGFVRRVVE